MTGAISKRALGQTPIAMEGRLFFLWQHVRGPVLRVLGAVLIRGVVAQPELHFVITPTAEEIVKPAAARIAAGQMRRIAQTALSQFGVKFPVDQMVSVQHVKT